MSQVVPVSKYGALNELIPLEVKRAIAADGDGLHETLVKLVQSFQLIRGELDALTQERDANARLLAVAPDLLTIAEEVTIDLSFYYFEVGVSVKNGALTVQEGFDRLQSEMKKMVGKLDLVISRATEGV